MTNYQHLIAIKDNGVSCLNLTDEHISFTEKLPYAFCKLCWIIFAFTIRLIISHFRSKHYLEGTDSIQTREGAFWAPLSKKLITKT